jgi:hypothetical protein
VNRHQVIGRQQHLQFQYLQMAPRPLVAPESTAYSTPNEVLPSRPASPLVVVLDIVHGHRMHVEAFGDPLMSPVSGWITSTHTISSSSSSAAALASWTRGGASGESVMTWAITPAAS